MTLRLCILIVISLISVSVYAQSDFSPATWHWLDTSIAQKRNLVDLRQQVNRLHQKALSEKKYLLAARCIRYRILIDDQLTEDTLYFKNSVILDELLNSKQPLLYQFSLHLLQAQRLAGFKSKYKRFGINRYERRDIPVNYAEYDNVIIDSFVNQHFETAKAITAQIKDADVNEALWLSADPLQFLFRPGLFDIAMAEQIRNSPHVYYAGFSADFLIKNLSFSQPEFIALADTITRADKFFLARLQLYKSWMAHHSANHEAAMFIETLLRKFIYSLVNNNRNKAEANYEVYLKNCTASPYNTVKAHSVFQLCMLWNSQSKKYYPSSGYDYQDYDYVTGGYKEKEFDTAYRYHAVKAIELFKQHDALLDSFQYLKNLLQSMEVQIKSQSVSLSVQRNNLPGENFIAGLKFKNAAALHYRISRAKNDYLYQPADEVRQDILAVLNSPALFEQTVSLPAMNDYNLHGTFVKINALSPGDYTLVYSAQPITDSNALLHKINFSVTNIALINSDKRIYVLHRKTGLPLNGAKLKAVQRKQTRKDSTGVYFTENVQYYTTNSRGYAKLKDDKHNIIHVSLPGDTTWQQTEFSDTEETPEDIYTKEEYDNLVEYYEENAIAYIYTDRSIYRPGQAVFFKAIFLTLNPKTGEPLLMSKENLKGKMFGKVYEKWLKDENPMLYLQDPFGKEMDSVKIRPNDFGSVSGFFKIPKTAATGEWDIEPDYIETNYRTGSFKVEEYKKPSYEVTIEKPKKELKPGDDFSFTVKLKSFSGAPLNNVKVNYSVDRSGNIPESETVNGKPKTKYYTENLTDSSGFTNEEGELKIEIKDSLLKNILFDKKETWSYRYAMNAETFDATGENYEANESMEVSTRPVRIRIPLNAQYERKDWKPVLITTEDINAGTVNKTVKLKLYRLRKEEKIYSSQKLIKTDVWLYDKEKLKQEFPLLNFENKKAEETRELVAEKTIDTGKNEKLNWDENILQAGKYELEATTEENGIITGETKKNFSVYDLTNSKTAEATWNFNHTPFNYLSQGDTLQWFYGNSEAGSYSIFHAAWYSGAKKTKANAEYVEQFNEKGLHKFLYKIPAGAKYTLKLTRVFVLNNEVLSKTENITINAPAEASPEIIVEKYRKKMTPGSKETFSVSIKTKNENTAAELMTTLYDASLEKLEKHEWMVPDEIRDYRRGSVDVSWTDYINYEASGSYGLYQYEEAAFIQPGHAAANKYLWWVNPLDFAYTATVGDFAINAPHPSLRRNYARGETYEYLDFDDISTFSGNAFYANTNLKRAGYGFAVPSLELNLSGRIAGLSIADTDGLNEVVVAAVRISRKELGYSLATVKSVVIRGASSLVSYDQPLIILDGVPFKGDLKTIDPKLITAGLVLKGADAAAIYGAAAANGVLVLSTKGEIIFPQEPEPVITPRKNFNETAFFFPAIYAGKDGYYTFSFTMPESVTEWNWKLFAHTKNLLFATAERKLNTQLPLMVQPNMPRVLYQGDRMILQSRIANLDTVNAAGKIKCKIEDVVTGNDITSAVVSANQKNFSVGKKSNTVSGFEIKVPTDQTNPLKITVTVSSENFADGEEHIIPVLSPKIFVRQQTPFTLLKNKDSLISLPVLPADAKPYGIGLNIQAKPQAALLYSLPYLANFPFGCAEQTFNKMLAHITALHLMRKDSAIQQSFASVKSFTEKQTDEKQLPDIPGEEAMPWLSLANDHATKQTQLYNLLDTFRTKEKIYELADKIFKMQSAGGGLSWFPGGNGNFYISAYVLRGFGKLGAEKKFKPKEYRDNEYNQFIEKLVKYCDNHYFNLSDKDKTYSLLHYAYARSFWLQQYRISDTLFQSIRRKTEQQWNDVHKLSLHNQALLCIISMKYTEAGQQTLITKVKDQLRSIRQLAIQDETNGTRWKELADADDMSVSSEEAIGMLAEAFAESKSDNDINSGIVKWLLTASNEHHWSSTKATAAAIDLIEKENKTAVGPSQILKSEVSGNSLFASDDIISGNNFSFTKTTSLPAQVKIEKQSNQPAAGNMAAYYFTATPKSAGINNFISIEKTLYKWNIQSSSWEKINDGATVKMSDRIKVTLKIRAEKMLEYVYVDDKRSAAMEPEDKSSGYDYNGGLSYYKSIRDAGFQLFFDKIPSGIHEISYEMKTVHEGSFINGPVSLQCMYRPDISAYANGIKFNVVKGE